MSLAFCTGAKNWQRQEGGPTCQQRSLHHQDVLERRLGDTCSQEPKVIPAGLASQHVLIPPWAQCGVTVASQAAALYVPTAK